MKEELKVWGTSEIVIVGNEIEKEVKGPGGLMGNVEGASEVGEDGAMVTNIYLLYSVAFPRSAGLRHRDNG